MRSESDQFVAVGLAVVVILVIAYILYRPRIQQSKQYQATVVPLANIMDVGFIIMSPAIVLLAGFAAPLVMLGVCLVAIAAGFAIAYHIRHFEPLEETDDPLNRVERTAQWALLGASIVNIATTRCSSWRSSSCRSTRSPRAASRSSGRSTSPPSQ